MMTAAPEFLLVREVAARYRLTKTSVMNKLKDGRLQGIKIGGTWRIYADQFIELEKRAA